MSKYSAAAFVLGVAFLPMAAFAQVPQAPSEQPLVQTQISSDDALRVQLIALLQQIIALYQQLAIQQGQAVPESADIINEVTQPTVEDTQTLSVSVLGSRFVISGGTLDPKSIRLSLPSDVDPKRMTIRAALSDARATFSGDMHRVAPNAVETDLAERESVLRAERPSHRFGNQDGGWFEFYFPSQFDSQEFDYNVTYTDAAGTFEATMHKNVIEPEESVE